LRGTGRLEWWVERKRNIEMEGRKEQVLEDQKD